MNSAILSTLLLSAALASGSSSSSSELDRPFSESFSRLDHAGCVSLFYRNGRIGCGTADRSLQIGQLRYFDGENVPNTDGPYVAVMEDYVLDAQPMALLMDERQNGLIQGVLVLNSTSIAKDKDSGWKSPAGKNPQGYGTPSTNVNYGNIQFDWNNMGTGIIHYDLHGLPMAYVIQSSVSDTLREEAKESSVDSEIVAEFDYYMGPEQMNSVDCLSWKDAVNDEWSPKCLPLGGSSVWATAGSPPGAKTDKNAVAKPVVIIGAGMDATALFHDLVPAASSAASNILTLLMAAKLVGEIDDETLGALNYQIVFSLFQAEAHGFVGSRAFFRDLAYPGFQCNRDLVRAVPRLGELSEYACLDPLYPSLKFSDLGEIVGMLSLDQLGVIANGNLFFVHADENNDNYGSFLSQVLQQFSNTNSGFKVYKSSAGSNGNGYPYPPTPLTSLLSLSEGSVGGAVLTGYDTSYSSSIPYHSFKETASFHNISLKAIAASATIAARAAFAAAYDGGNYNSAAAAQYAENLIPELSYGDGALVALSNCLLYDGECENILQYASVRAANEQATSGLSTYKGVLLGNPPNYYVGVYNKDYGQPFVKVGDKTYGRYDGEEFGKNDQDAMGITPSMLENAVHGLLDDFLGRGSADFSAKRCKKQTDCQSVQFCENEGELPTCTGGRVCVCSRASFHRALDEALEPAKNRFPGYFEVSDDDPGLSPIYAEPYWSTIGVRVYRDVGPLPGLLTLLAGAAGMATSLCAAFLVRVGLKKEKLY